jgi:hypothetical protein
VPVGVRTRLHERSLNRPATAIVSARKYLAGLALAVGMITASWAAQRTVLRALPACPNVKDFTDWLEATERGNASALDILDGKGYVEVNIQSLGFSVRGEQSVKLDSLYRLCSLKEPHPDASRPPQATSHIVSIFDSTF